MSNYQVTNYGCCGECKWHSHCKKVAGFKCRDEWVCINPDSDYYILATDYTDTCEEWEQRGIDNE